MAFEISVRADVKELSKRLDSLAYEQLPFATALAVTGLARRVQEAETKGLAATFDRPTPFTMRAFGVKPARKADPTATVFARDIQAAYLEPYEFGGKQVLGSKRAILNPKDIALNVYGNIPRGQLKRLKGRSDVFIGSVKFKSGATISGVWQRPARGARRHGGRGTKGNVSNIAGANTGLKLLIRFTDPVEVHQRLHYFERAQQIVDRWFNAEFSAGMRKALATAR